LIAAANLQPAVEAVVQHKEVVRLQQGVAELGVRDAILALDSALHRLFGDHGVDGEVLADIGA
jgi:hypothetical protein